MIKNSVSATYRQYLEYHDSYAKIVPHLPSDHLITRYVSHCKISSSEAEQQAFDKISSVNNFYKIKFDKISSEKIQEIEKEALTIYNRYAMLSLYFTKAYYFDPAAPILEKIIDFINLVDRNS
jgi:hypothetical protein